MNPLIMSGSTTTGSLLTAPTGTPYTTPAAVDARTLYSTEATTNSVKTEMNMFDAIIGVAILVIIGLIIYLVASSKQKVAEGAPKKKK